jgi:hypothetical protein
MRFESDAALGDGWRVERLAPDGSVRFARPPSVDRRKALSRFIVMGGCFAVTAALVGVSAQSADGLWWLTASLIGLFGLTGVVALLSGLTDLRRANVGVFLELDVSASRVRGLLDGQGLAGQFRVARHEAPLSACTVRLVPFEDSTTGGGMLVVTEGPAHRFLAPDLPQIEALRRWLEGLPRSPTG